ncbi:Na+/H+ antiporter NhaC family protein [Virgibacillus sp. DJP39]|uniref:Na+/H+ antiporter NhaC family protein n=1 Tax=Virgibacillus sp. DJP39 TaxID=3409790 RepID=UPI003BB53BC4
MDYGLWLSIAPSLIAIALATWTKQVIPSLLIGLWAGSFILTGSFLGSISQTVDYIVGVLSDPGNLDVLLFLYVFSVALVQLSGGVQAFAKVMNNYINNSKKTLIASWLLLPITFIDCGFRVVATGSIMKPLADRFSVSRERLAYMLNNSASPVIVLIPVATTYIGYILGVLNKGMGAAGIEGSAMQLFLSSLPFQFFSFTSITIALLSVIIGWNFGSMRKLIQSAHGSKKETSFSRPAHAMEMSEEIGNKDKADTAKDQMGVTSKGKMEKMDMDMGLGKPALKPRLFNLLTPILVLIPLSFFLMWLSGQKEAKGESLVEVFSAADPSRSMFLALFITVMITAALYLFQGLKLKEMTDRFIKGGNKLMVTIVILVVAWPISDVSQDLGLTELIRTTLGGTLTPIWVPVLIFAVTGAVTYFIGSSWGAWALMMPIAIPLAVTTGGSVPLAVAAVLSGGTFGDVTSPVSGMTAMSAGAAGADHMKYVKAMTPYNVLAAALAAGLFLVVPLIF